MDGRANRLFRAELFRGRALVFIGLDACFLVFYLLLATTLAPAREGLARVVEWGMVLSMLAALGGMCVPNRTGWLMASAGCAALLVFELLLLVGLLWSASYLSGVYGSFGQAASSLAIVVAVLSIELVALVPSFQLAYLRSKKGRRRFGA